MAESCETQCLPLQALDQIMESVMKSSDEVPVEATTQSVEGPAEVATRPVENNAIPTVSAGKVAANRENAHKSTDPKTPRGKANSRTNALKHGLFAMDVRVESL